MDSLARRLENVQERLHAAARQAGRNPAEITLVAVSKTRPVEDMIAASALGVRNFGENRVEEATQKIPRVQETLGHAGVHPIWHAIGHLQRRKVRNAVALFDWIHAVDRFSVAREISKRCVAAQNVIPVLLEINVSGEAQKYGFSVPGGLANPPAVGSLYREVEQIANLPGITIRGLMTMAPWEADAERTRPVFRALRELRDDLQKRFPALTWDHLSMGMTQDFVVAIEEGATMVRIGTAIFGPRTCP